VFDYCLVPSIATACCHMQIESIKDLNFSPKIKYRYGLHGNQNQKLDHLLIVYINNKKQVKVKNSHA